MSIIAVEGPADWEKKESVYMRIQSAAKEFLHTFYILESYADTEKQWVSWTHSLVWPPCEIFKNLKGIT